MVGLWERMTQNRAICPKLGLVSEVWQITVLQCTVHAQGQCCGTVPFWLGSGSGSGSDFLFSFIRVLAPVMSPVPYIILIKNLNKVFYNHISIKTGWEKNGLILTWNVLLLWFLLNIIYQANIGPFYTWNRDNRQRSCGKNDQPMTIQGPEVALEGRLSYICWKRGENKERKYETVTLG